MNYAKNISTLLIALMAMTSQSLILAQEPPARPAVPSQLTLFEEVETTESRTNSPARPDRQTRVTTAEPDFTLLGTSRIGESYSAMIQHRSGETIMVKASPRGNTVIENYAGYTLVDISAGNVSIRYPNGTDCVAFPDRGVRCNGASNIAELVLANGDPIVSRTPSQPAAEQLAGDGDTEQNQEAPTNPFEALRNGVAGQADNTNGNRFTPRRINPEDVPEGMRIIATPFGDRLVEQ